MRINNVHIHAFGPFNEQTLELADAMTVVVGDNESGKSSWHAAIYAALCGMRRGQGQPPRENRDFRDQHRPWDGNSWSVRANLELADGRLVEITQDLDGVDRRAVDIGLGRRDISSEIMFEQSPDASRWLGLDRRTFRATACVRQTEVLDVVDRADALQEHLQRAAATGGADQTAAHALEVLRNFHSERVGTLHPNSQRPLRSANLAVEQAKNSFQAARNAHQTYLAQLENVKQLDGQVAEATRNLAIIEAASALHNATEAAGMAEQARRMADRMAELEQRPLGPPASPVSIPLLVAAAIIGVAGVGIGLLTTPGVVIAALAIAAGLVVIAVHRHTRAMPRVNKSKREPRDDMQSPSTGRNYEEFARTAEQAHQLAEKLMVGLPRDQVEAAAGQHGLDGQLADAQRKKDEAACSSAEAKGELNARSMAAANVSASEEVLTAAQAELDRVRRLDATLTRTREFLERAQDRVHREFAPHLEKILRDWLPCVTNRRYTEASVDPISLRVKVMDVGGKFREARLLSQGTREQIYLLLRMALVAFLTKPGEVSPLIFDDVTVQTDSIRTEAVLNLLYEMSGTRQVIVFSQEEDVRRWAEKHLVNEERYKMIRLSSPV
jgi:hypothetical protein